MYTTPLPLWIPGCAGMTRWSGHPLRSLRSASLLSVLLGFAKGTGLLFDDAGSATYF